MGEWGGVVDIFLVVNPAQQTPKPRSHTVSWVIVGSSHLFIDGTSMFGSGVQSPNSRKIN